MSIVALLVPMALALAGSALAAFLWCAARGQYDDLETPAHKILLDDEEPELERNKG